MVCTYSAFFNLNYFNASGEDILDRKNGVEHLRNKRVAFFEGGGGGYNIYKNENDDALAF